jgi:hypothetical protein
MILVLPPTVQQPIPGLCHLIFYVSRMCTIRHIPCRTPVNEWSACHRGLYWHNPQQTLGTNIHALSGFQTHNPSNWMGTDLCLRLHGCWDQLIIVCAAVKNHLVYLLKWKIKKCLFYKICNYSTCDSNGNI